MCDVSSVFSHRYDYGAIILCDERFNSPNTKGALSMWLRPFIQKYLSVFFSYLFCVSPPLIDPLIGNALSHRNFGATTAGLTKFFKSAKSSGWERPLKALK